jgi:hypothetical protein
MELKVGTAAFTVSVVEPWIDPDVAWIVDDPAATPVASPETETVAAAVFDELHVAEFVMFWVLASENVPVAVNC